MKRKHCSLSTAVMCCTVYLFTWVDLPWIHRTLTLDFGFGWGTGLVNLGFLLTLGFREGSLSFALPFLDLSIGYDTSWDCEEVA